MENKKPVLLVLAAGMGSRYGGLKQMDAFGPNGETIIDYSIYDAIKAGFGKVVFIIREHFKEAFEQSFNEKFKGMIEFEYVTQELDKIPAGKNIHQDRQKPWGTAHAVMMAKDAIDAPFCVINADDYYGVEAYQTIADYFKEERKGEIDEYAVVGYYLKNTLSDHGTVNRGVCKENQDQYLVDIEECTKIARKADGQISYNTEDGEQFLTEETLVSMNMFGFYPSFFEWSEEMFADFLDNRGMELKSEFFIPFALDEQIKADKLKVKVLRSPSHWFGVTYQEDKPIVVEKLNKLIEEGVYPSKLW